jgi:Uma2 family endonuclease
MTDGDLGRPRPRGRPRICAELGRTGRGERAAFDDAAEVPYSRHMPTLHIELPSHAAQVEPNLRRWAEVIADPELAKLEGRIETDRHGHVLMTPPPAPKHGALQSEIAFHLRSLSTDGRVMTECPVSTADGVKSADVAWASPARLTELADGVCFPHAPEVCVEVRSPGNTDSELREKTALFFDAGASEVWICTDNGAMQFYPRDMKGAAGSSALFPTFPHRIRLR